MSLNYKPSFVVLATISALALSSIVHAAPNQNALDNANPNAAFNQGAGGSTGGAGSSFSGSAQGDASITIAVPVQISQAKALNFGEVIRSNNQAGTVKVDKNGTRTGTNVVLQNNADVSNGIFSIFGDKNRQVSVSIDRSATLTNEQGATLTVNTEGDTAMQTLNGNGQASYKVGGTIAINQNQPSGNYSGTYNVTVSY